MPNPRCIYALSFAADAIAFQVSQHHAIPHWPTPTKHPSSALAALLAAETKSILRGFRAAIWQMKSSDDDWGEHLPAASTDEGRSVGVGEGCWKMKYSVMLTRYELCSACLDHSSRRLSRSEEVKMRRKSTRKQEFADGSRSHGRGAKTTSWERSMARLSRRTAIDSRDERKRTGEEWMG